MNSLLSPLFFPAFDFVSQHLLPPPPFLELGVFRPLLSPLFPCLR